MCIGKTGGKGGGVLIAVRNTLVSSAAPELEVEDCELLWVRVKLKGRRTLYLCAYYRPSISDETSLRKLGQSLERCSQSSSPHRMGLVDNDASSQARSPLPRPSP